ncbi:MAG: hypothetical protein LJE62_01020 [Silicimonas sp.]|nr:hypothetical protein [Silicimonas sp.]
MRLPAAIASLVFSAPAFASDAVRGNEATFTSPNGVTERCVRIAKMPGADYSNGDVEDEEAYCAIDFYDAGVALCPKTWSTSPGTMIYDISEGSYANDRAAFERNACHEGKSAKDLAADELAKFKMTMNASGTSGTYAPSSLVYYHLSRFLDTSVEVPVAVWRSMDAAAHRSEVSERGLAMTGSAQRMNHEGWRHLINAEANPASYVPTDDIMTLDRMQVYGVLLLSPGHRYGSEINGTRKSGWGAGQNRDFQETPAYRALRTDAPLPEAITTGLEGATRDRQIRKDLGDQGTPQQMVFWMRELSEIVLMDFIMSQQDRVGNIDFTPYWYWLEEGKAKHKKAKHHEPGDGDVPEGAILLRRTNLNDNDAGGRVAYANFAKTTEMLQKLRHFDGGVYRRLLALNTDLQKQGPIYEWLSVSIGLKDAEVRQFVNNTSLATGILQDNCRAGRLRFDLNPTRFFETGDADEDEVDCG